MMSEMGKSKFVKNFAVKITKKDLNKIYDLILYIRFDKNLELPRGLDIERYVRFMKMTRDPYLFVNTNHYDYSLRKNVMAEAFINGKYVQESNIKVITVEEALNKIKLVTRS